jgi:propanol-preferring alcohol dehydrogenase
MKAMVLDEPGVPLRLCELDPPSPDPDQVLIEIHTCAVCRTDLHVFDGDLTEPKLPLIMGHEIVGTVIQTGSEVDRLEPGQRVGVPWLGRTCGSCDFCRAGAENLCDQAECTGYQLDGGYAEYTVADHRFCFPIPDLYTDSEAAPLLCAGLIGYRSLRLTGEARRLGLYGFGASAHIVAQVARHREQEIYAFTRPGDVEGQDLARSLGAVWAGDSETLPPADLDAAILFAPVGALVPQSLNAVRKGGTVVCAGIHMSDIPTFPYELLWGERVVRSVANLTRQDGVEFLQIAPEVPVRTIVETFPLEEANQALERLRAGQIQGAAVLVMADSSSSPA